MESEIPQLVRPCENTKDPTSRELFPGSLPPKTMQSMIDKALDHFKRTYGERNKFLHVITTRYPLSYTFSDARWWWIEKYPNSITVFYDAEGTPMGWAYHHEIMRHAYWERGCHWLRGELPHDMASFKRENANGDKT